MGDILPLDCNEVLKEGATNSSSSAVLTTPTTSHRSSEGRSVLATNEMKIHPVLQNCLPQHLRCIAQEPDREEIDSFPSTASLRNEKQVDYLERRRKNNDSARRSREVRRQREALNRRQVEMLEKENTQLRAQIALLRLEVGQLSFVLLTEGVKLLS